MGLSVWQLLIIAAVILVLFGRGKISEMMGDFGKGVKSFKQGMTDDEKVSPPAQLGTQNKEGAAADAKPADKVEKP